MPAMYAELQVTSNYSFLRGGAHPAELVQQSALLGQRAIALTDRNSLAGIVRAHVAAKEDPARGAGLRFIPGARLDLADCPSLLCLPRSRAAYGRLSRLITIGRRRAPKGQCELLADDLEMLGADQTLILLPQDRDDAPVGTAILAAAAARLAPLGLGWLAACHRLDGGDEARLADLAGLAQALGLRLVATNDVHYHLPGRRALQDVLTCIRTGCTIQTAGLRLAANAERHLKAPAEMARLFRDHAPALQASVEIAEACRFSLDELAYDYPDEITLPGLDAQATLEQLTREGLARRYPGGAPPAIAKTVAHELQLIGQLNYAPYFLTVHDLVRFADARGILCQGRGSAANSAVCYMLGITAVDPVDIDLLFERFISAERGEPPDIDVDFEHEHREKVIQYIYDKYGRDRAGLTASVSCYRAKGAIREVGKAMGLTADVTARLTTAIWGWSEAGIDAARVREAGLDPDDPILALTLELARDLIGFPRHLSQHVGGFVITRGRLDELVPVTNAAMDDRTVIEWDKDDLDALRILKVDVLALGMLTAIQRAFKLIAAHGGEQWSLAGIPGGDPAVYAMLSRADSIGVFQVESRAQMSMLPRLKPEIFYDLVIQVAIVRPGPIQGGMVHPYLRRRAGKEKLDYPLRQGESAPGALWQVLHKTLGVPLFQEQAMKIAIVAGGFTPAESDKLRRAMATFRHAGTIHQMGEKLISGMVANGYERDFAERCFRQIEGFGTYGFPESHAAAFARLVYVSAWIKCHHPAVFAAALLNSQPMGFYAPAQLVRDAAEHGVAIRPADVNHSQWDCTLEPAISSAGGLALRLGLRQIRGLREDEAKRLLDARANGYASPQALWRRAALSPQTLARLAAADACASMGLSRRAAEWAVRGLGEPPPPLLARLDPEEPAVVLPVQGPGAAVVQDYRHLGLSLTTHPLALLRPFLPVGPPTGAKPRRGAPRDVLCRDLANVAEDAVPPVPKGLLVRLTGLVLVRQRPGTASGTIFMTLEDETGSANVIVWPAVFARCRRIVMTSTLAQIVGRVERGDGGVTHLLADDIQDRADLLGRLNDDEIPLSVPLAIAPDRGAALRDPSPDVLPHLSRDFH